MVVPELRLVSVVFVDLVGFTALSEGRAAEDVRELLDRYFAIAKRVVGRYDGVIAKFIGDAVMAVWGSTVAREDDGERAVRAALEIVDAVGVFGEQVGAAGLRARAGVVTGQAAAMEDPGEGIIVGDRVNTASRAQSVAQPGTVVVDEVTRQVTEAVFAFQDAGEHTVKGKTEPLHLWRAVRVVAGAGGRDREQLIEAPFVGRDSELRLVKELLHATVDRRAARLVAISGEAGVGKSRLRRELFNYIDGLADLFLWHSGRCLSHGDGVAFWALGEMVRQRLGIAEDAAPREAAAKLEAGLVEWVPDAADREFVAPRLGALLGVASPGLDRAELFAGWRLFFEVLAAHEPVMLVFEDMQYADQGLLEFIEQLLDWTTEVPIFVLTLARPELASRPQGWPGGRRGAAIVNLEPLDDRAMRAIITGMVDGLPEDAAGRIVGRAQGIPLYAIETVRALVDRGTLELVDGRLVAAGDLGELEVPASLNALLASRLDALEAEERSLVKAMAVFGGSFPRDTAVALSDLEADGVERALTGLVRKQVLMIRADPLSPDRGQYAFAQGLLRTVAYERLSRRERKQRHLAAAEHLQRVFANDGEEVAEMIATHYLDAYHAAGEDSDADTLRRRAAGALRRSARRAANVGAPEVAQRSYEQAGELADDSEQPALIQAAGEMALQAGRSEDALVLLDRAAAAHARAGRDRDSAMTAYPAARALIRLGRPREAAERVAAALAALRPAQDMDPDVARLNASLGRALVFVGDYQHAAPAVEAALTVAEALELPDVLADALTHKAMLYGQTGRPQEARGLYVTALDVAEGHELAEVQSRARGNLANLAMLWDQPDARGHTEAALAVDRRRGDRHAESLSAGNLMTLHLYAGRWDELERLARELLDPDPHRPGTAQVHYRLVWLHALRGEADAATAALEHLAAWKDSDDPEYRSNYDFAMIAARLTDKPADALEHGLRTLPGAIETLTAAHDSIRDGWPDTLHAALRLARHAETRRLIALLGDLPPGRVPPYLRAQLARGQALLNAAEGRHATVEHDLSTAIDAFETLGYPYWHAVAQTDLAAWLLDQHRPEEAGPLLTHATGTLTPLRAAPALTRAHALTPTATTRIAS
jgi:class 3 adenylate cyclase/tetratricopeptide (TPR) repeat protein